MACLAVTLLLSSCRGAGGQRTSFEYMPDMMDAPSVKAQEQPMRVPVAGTLPQGFIPYPYAVEEGEQAGRVLKNELPRSREVLLRGQEVYGNTCIVCHGPNGKGKGYIVPKFPQPPSLTSDKMRQWPDGRIFHVMTMGQPVMLSRGSQISR